MKSSSKKLSPILFELNKLYSLVKKGTEYAYFNPKNNGTLEEQFMHRLIEEPRINELELQQDLYREKNDSLSKTYLMLRHSVRGKIMNLMSIVNPKLIFKSQFLVRYFQLQKDAYIVKLLLTIGFYKNGKKMANSVLSEAMKLEAWDVVLSVARLQSHYHAIRGEHRSYNKYNELVKDSLRYLDSELNLRSIINKWSLRFATKTRANKKEVRELGNDLRRAFNYLKKGDTLNNRHFYYRLRLLAYDSKLDYKGVLMICQEAIAKLKPHINYIPESRLGVYYGTQMYCYLNLRLFSEAKTLADDKLGVFLKGTLNWYLLREYYFVLSLQSDEFQTAYEIVQEVTNSETYGQLPESQKQMWTILEGYMQFVIVAKIWKDHPTNINLPKFKVERFINLVPKYSRDKMGTYVSILILQVLFLIQHREYAKIIERSEAIDRYRRRYLYTKENERSRVFLTLLKRMVAYNFDALAIEIATSRLSVQLEKKTANYSANLGGNEIVDYEILWEWILKRLREDE